MAIVQAKPAACTSQPRLGAVMNTSRLSSTGAIIWRLDEGNGETVVHCGPPTILVLWSSSNVHGSIKSIIVPSLLVAWWSQYPIQQRKSV